MKTKILIFTAALVALMTFNASAQTATNPADVTGITTAINSVVIDTNSDFFAGQKFELRTGAAQMPQGTLADVGGDVNFGSQFQAGADILFSTGSSVISAAQADVAYRIPIHNVEFDPLLGAGYNWDSETGYGVAGLRFSYVISPANKVGAWVQPQVQEDFKTLGRPNLGIFGGVSYSF